MNALCNYIRDGPPTKSDSRFLQADLELLASVTEDEIRAIMSAYDPVLNIVYRVIETERIQCAPALRSVFCFLDCAMKLIRPSSYLFIGLFTLEMLTSDEMATIPTSSPEFVFARFLEKPKEIRTSDGRITASDVFLSDVDNFSFIANQFGVEDPHALLPHALLSPVDVLTYCDLHSIKNLADGNRDMWRQHAGHELEQQVTNFAAEYSTAHKRFIIVAYATCGDDDRRLIVQHRGIDAKLLKGTEFVMMC